MTDLRTKAIEAFKSFCINWGSRNQNTVFEAMGQIHRDFNGFGSNTQEVWHSKNDLLKQLEEEIHQISNPYDINFIWIECSILAHNTILVYGELSLVAKVSAKVIILEKVRNTLVFEHISGELHIRHWHCSLPDVGTKGEVIPGAKEPKRYKKVSVLFCDFVGFTKIVSEISPKKLVSELSDIYQNFDRIISEESLEKIQVYGDGYLAVCGLPEVNPKHAIQSVKAGKRILSYLGIRNDHSSIKWHARIGIHSGPLVAGIIGERKFSFNIFGDTVNTAARLETASLSGRINISKSTYDLIKSVQPCEYRGKIEAKGKGEIDMYFVLI